MRRASRADSTEAVEWDIGFDCTLPPCPSAFSSPAARSTSSTTKSTPGSCSASRTSARCCGSAAAGVDVHLRTIMMIDSLDMSDADRDAIVQNCRQCEETRIVITHGTDTMVETARALAAASGVDGKTIVLTGAMIPYAFGSSDGMFNLGSALSFVQVLPPGVYVAMNGRCFDVERGPQEHADGGVRNGERRSDDDELTAPGVAGSRSPRDGRARDGRGSPLTSGVSWSIRRSSSAPCGPCGPGGRRSRS